MINENVKYNLYENDLPNDVIFGNEIAIDTEALGLNNLRDRLCLVQITDGSGVIYMVHFSSNNYDAPNLVKLLTDDSKLKIMHFARFDVAILQKTFNIEINNIYCTKIASKIARTYTDAHGLKTLVKEVYNIDISKKEQSSYWGGEINEDQKKYAGNDVLYLHGIKKYLDNILTRENRMDYVKECCKFLKTRVKLDLNGWIDEDIFSH